MTNKKFDKLMDKLFNYKIPHSIWWNSHTVKTPSILFLVTKGLENGKKKKNTKKHSPDSRKNTR
jgi:hypothetical protein